MNELKEFLASDFRLQDDEEWKLIIQEADTNKDGQVK